MHELKTNINTPNFDNIKQKIKIKQENLLNETFPKAQELEYLYEIVQQIKSNDIEVKLNIKFSNFLLFLMRSISPETDFNIHLSSIEVFSNTFDKCVKKHEKDLLKILVSLKRAIEKNYLNKMIEILFAEATPVNKSISIKKAIIELSKQQYKDEIGNLMLKIVNFFQTPEIAMSFLDIITKFKDTDLIDGLISYCLLDYYYELYFKGKIITQIVSFSNAKNQHRINNNLNNAVLSESNISPYFNRLTSYYSNLEFEKENRKNNNKRKYVNYQLIISTLEKKLTQPVITIDQNFEKLLNIDSEIKYDVLSIIIEHNSHSYKKLHEENKIHEDNSITQLEKMFFKYNLNINLMKAEDKLLLLQLKSNSEIDAILTSLNQSLFAFLKITDSYFIDILLYSTPEIIEDIINFNKAGIITPDFLSQHIGILIPNHQSSPTNIAPLYSTIKTNISIFQKHRIQLEMLSEEEKEILTYPTEKVESILTLLSFYHIPLNKNNVSIFIQYPSRINSIDSFIELGLYDLLLQNFELTNDNNILKRIIILKSINMPIINKYKKIPNSTLTGKNFYIPTDSLDDYIINHTSLYLDSEKIKLLNSNPAYQISYRVISSDKIAYLEKNYKSDDLTYRFNDITISRIKVLRHFELLNQYFDDIDDNLFTSIIYQSYLSGEQIEEIKECLSSKVKKY